MLFPDVEEAINEEKLGKGNTIKKNVGSNPYMQQKHYSYSLYIYKTSKNPRDYSVVFLRVSVNH